MKEYEKIVKKDFSLLRENQWGDFNSTSEVVFAPFSNLLMGLFTMVLYPLYLMIVLPQINKKVTYRELYETKKNAKGRHGE